jgi:hypothetical protein
VYIDMPPGIVGSSNLVLVCPGFSFSTVTGMLDTVKRVAR